MNNGVGIQQENILAICNIKPLIIGAGEAPVFPVLNQSDIREGVFDKLNSAIGTVVINDNYFKSLGQRIALERQEALIEVVSHIPANDDNRQFHEDA